MGNPLEKKLGFKEGMKIFLVNPPEDYFTLFEILPEIKYVEEPEPNEIDFVHFFTKDIDELKQMVPELKKLIHKQGMIWISWPKKSSGVETTVSGNEVRKYGLETGLVDVKVCSINDIWSATRFVYRLKDR